MAFTGLPMLKGYFSRLPLTDRVTFSRELVSGSLYGVYTGIALPLIPIVARRIGMSAAGITAMMTMQFVGALFGVLFGHLADRREKMPFVFWPGVVSRGMIALLALARTPVSFLIVVSGFNLLVNLGAPAYSSIMRSNYSNINRGRLMGNIRILIVAISAAVSTVAGLLLARNEGAVIWLFVAASGFGVLSSLAFARIKVRREPMPAGERPVGGFRSSFQAVRRNTPFVLFMGIMFLCATPDKLAVPLEPIWMVDFLHLGYSDASFLLGGVVSAASIVGYFVWARALKRFNNFAVLTAVVFLFAARFLALGLARTSAQLLPMSLLTGVVNAGWDLVPIFCIIALADRANFSLYIGMNTTFFGIRGLVGPTIGTFLYSSGALPLGWIFIFISALLAVGGAALGVFAYNHGRRSPGRIGLTAR
jgi:MFS family permease